MKLDLAMLQQMHPRLLPTNVAELCYRAAVGLERHGHERSVPMAVQLDSTHHDGTLAWIAADHDAAVQLDRHQVTEWAAEAISLVVVSAGLGWAVARRGQRGDSCDWWLKDHDGELAALEVSGIDSGDTARRLRDKMLQVQRAPDATHAAACVVELASPRTDLATATG
jgi:hypothetical protein